MKKISILLFIVLFAAKCSWAQFNIVFIPDVYGKTMDGLGVFQIQNLTGKILTGNFIITVKENRSKLKVVNLKTQIVTIQPGVSSFPRSSFSGSTISFADNAIASIVSQTRNFPPGEYTYCYNFAPVNKYDDPYDNCFDASIQPMVPISLINPNDKDTICQKRPVLSWQPPMPFNASMRFRLLLTEKKSGASIENLLANSPIILLDNISSTTINYPSTSPDLVEGKTYCWQVIAYQQGVIISTSEIWEFTVQCKPAPGVNSNDSYRELKMLVNGNYYIANEFLKFSFTNNYNVKKLTYAIVDMENNMKEVKNIPDVPLVQGLNKIDIDLTSLGLIVGKHYLLKVYPFNENNIEVRFTYQENNNPE